jgi:hypothetical protein
MKPKQPFSPRQIVATPGALEACTIRYLMHCLRRHVRGDWDVVWAEDAHINDETVSLRLRILSAYPIDPDQPSKGYGDNTIWIITEADRSCTTFLLPEEY